MLNLQEDLEYINLGLHEFNSSKMIGSNDDCSLLHWYVHSSGDVYEVRVMFLTRSY